MCGWTSGMSTIREKEAEREGDANSTWQTITESAALLLPLVLAMRRRFGSWSPQLEIIATNTRGATHGITVPTNQIHDF